MTSREVSRLMKARHIARKMLGIKLKNPPIVYFPIVNIDKENVAQYENRFKYVIPNPAPEAFGKTDKYYKPIYKAIDWTDFEYLKQFRKVIEKDGSITRIKVYDNGEISLTSRNQFPQLFKEMSNYTQ